MLSAGMSTGVSLFQMPLSSHANFLPKSHCGVEIVPSLGHAGNEELSEWWLHGHVGMLYG